MLKSSQEQRPSVHPSASTGADVSLLSCCGARHSRDERGERGRGAGRRATMRLGVLLARAKTGAGEGERRGVGIRGGRMRAVWGKEMYSLHIMFSSRSGNTDKGSKGSRPCPRA
jgi:hypothetical protein